MNSRERILAALNHKEADRIAITDGPWETTIERWHKEGLPEDQTPTEYFGYEMEGSWPDFSLQLPEEVIEETTEYKIVRNSDGATVKNWKHQTSTPGYTDFLIKDRKIWDEYKHRLTPNPDRVKWDEEKARHERYRKEGKFLWYGGAFGYDRTQAITGSERLLMAMIEEPEWATEMFSMYVDVLLAMHEEMVGRGFEFDGAYVCNDMGYRNGLLFSPQLYRELLFPHDKRLCDFFKQRNMPIILHSCGRVKDLIPELIRAGFTCLNPLEVKAGMDLIKLKKQYGDVLAFMGGIDTRAMKNPETIEEEVKPKITFAKKGGGYIYHSDHSVPDNVSFQNYCKVIELVNKYGKY